MTKTDNPFRDIPTDMLVERGKSLQLANKITNKIINAAIHKGYLSQENKADIAMLSIKAARREGLIELICDALEERI